MNENVINFIQQQTCATISCVDEKNRPYCFSCFYAFNSDEGLLYFKSAADTHHSMLMKKNPFVAGTILPDKLNPLLVKGLQFEGLLLEECNALCKYAPGAYYRKHPMAIAIRGEIRVIQINSIKMTDSTMGFGKKITWNRTESLVEQ